MTSHVAGRDGFVKIKEYHSRNSTGRGANSRRMDGGTAELASLDTGVSTESKRSAPWPLSCFFRGMHASPQTILPVVLSGTTETAHPTERSLSRYAAGEMGPQRKKIVARHLENCADCRKTVAHLHEIARRFRDLERRAIAHVAAQAGY